MPLVVLDGVAELPESERRRAIAERVQGMQLEAQDVPFAAYVAKLESDGGIVEERIIGEELLSPSVQLRALPDGTVELLSTHDQLLGGASGQSYLGCTFPADPAYSRLISHPAMAVGKRLAAEGVLGRFAVDFVVVRDAAGEWSAYAIELNLRKGGTTHPFLTLQFLTDGRYDGPSGRFLTPEGPRSTSWRPTTSRRTRSGRSRSATCSTRSPGTASTSTSPGRPASSST